MRISPPGLDCAAGRFHVGHWSSGPGVRRVACDETGFGPGDAFVIEAGFAGTRESIGRVSKLYAILDP